MRTHTHKTMHVISKTTGAVFMLVGAATATSSSGGGGGGDDHDHSTFIAAIVVLGVVALLAIAGLIVFGVYWAKREARISDQAYIAREVMRKQMQFNNVPAIATSGRHRRELAEMHVKSGKK